MTTSMILYLQIERVKKFSHGSMYNFIRENGDRREQGLAMVQYASVKKKSIIKTSQLRYL